MPSDDEALELEGREVAPFAVTRLNEEQSIRFAKTLSDPPRKPTPAMRRAAKAYRESVIEKRLNNSLVFDGI